MKKKRYLPFGYQMNEGNIIPDILESSAVQSILKLSKRRIAADAC